MPSVVAIALALAGCPRRGGDKPSEVTCDQVGTTLGEALRAERTRDPSGGGPDAEKIDGAIVSAVVESCKTDAWSASARSCFVNTGVDASAKCRSEVSDAQVQALEDRMDRAAAKVAPATCEELPTVITAALTEEMNQLPADERAALEAKIGPFASAIGAQCAGGWSLEARTCIRDASKASADAGRCARWLDEAQRQAYQDLVKQTFGEPPPPAGATR